MNILDLEIFSPFFDDGSDLFRPQVPKRARSSLQSVLQLGRLKRLQDDLLNLENDKNLDLNFAYPAIKRQQGSRYVLPLGRLKRTRIQPPNPKRQPKSILQIGRLKRDEILDNNDDINLAEIEANQHLDVDIKRLGILPLGRLRKKSGFQCNERSRFCRNGSEAARDLFERIGKAHVPMKSILPIGRLKRMDTESISF